MSALTRREILIAPAALLALGGAAATENDFAALERSYGGRLGVAALDTASGKRSARRRAG
jgi:hypothetical protein